MPRTTKGPTVKARVKRLFEALLDFANWEFDECDSKIQVNWQAEDSVNPKLIVRTTLADLHWLTKKDNYSSELTKPQIREALNRLKDFLKILEDNRTKTQGVDTWHFTLTLWSKDKEENIKQFEKAWEDNRPDKSKALEATYKKSAVSAEASQDEIDWRDICHAMLEKQKRLTTNELLSADEDMKFELDDIHVPLALVQRTKPDKRSGDVSPEQGSRLLQPTYEEKQRFRHEEFLAQVLQEGKGQSKGRRIAVIGEPGAGKTTLLQSLAFWILDKNLGLPIWISLADLQGKTVEEYLLQRWLKNALEVARVTPEQENVLLELFKKERVWLLLDGVDEIAGGSVGVGAQGIAPLQVVASQLEGWVAKARVVLSCRLNVWEANINALGDDFEKYRLLDFDYPLQVKEFICRWFRKTDADKGERLWAELDKSEHQRIQDLVKNPLRLALLCSTYDPPSPPCQGGSKDSLSSSYQGENKDSSNSSYQGESKDSLSSPPYQGGARGGSGLPSTKAGLYQRFVEAFYTWKENRFPTTEDQQEELNAALGRLAKRAIDQEASRFRLQHKLVREELSDPKQQGSLFWLALQLGWLNQVGLAAESETQEKVYAFFHPTFQEYFAALAIKDWDFFLPRAHDNNNPKPVSPRYRIFEPQWKEVILLWLGREDVAKEEREAFIKALVEFEDGCREGMFGFKGFYEYRAYFLAVAGIDEFRESSRAKEIVKQVVKWGFGEFNVKYQLQQTNVLRQISEKAKAIVLETHHPLVVAALINLIHTSLDDFTRIQAAEILGKIVPGHPKAIATLLELMHTCFDENDIFTQSIAVQAINSLGKIGMGNQEVIAALVNQLQTSPNSGASRYADMSLEQIAPRHPALKWITVSEDDLFQEVLKSRQIDLSSQESIEVLINLILTSTAQHSRLLALRGFEKVGRGNPKVIKFLIDLIHNNLYEDIRKGAVYILGKIGTDSPEAMTLLINLVRTSPDKGIRFHAVRGLGKSNTSYTEVIEALISIVSTVPPDFIRPYAAESLGQILQRYPLESAVSTLKDCLPVQLEGKNDWWLYEHCYDIIWHCTQNMAYPAFYQAWHQQEKVGNTTTPNSQSLNQANLPQSLHSAIANDPQLSQTIHLICIDGSNFIDPDRPAAEIYDQMLDQNCPECDRAVPETMPALKLYWNSLRRNSNKRPLLVFYASSTNPYSETFFTDLSKFKGDICIVTSPPTPLLQGEGSKSSSGSPSSALRAASLTQGEGVRGWGSLQFFTPSQAIEDIVQWIRAIVLEN